MRRLPLLKTPNSRRIMPVERPIDAALGAGRPRERVLRRSMHMQRDLASRGRTRYSHAMVGDQALIGTVLAERWEVLDPLGRGGMGSVYRARHVHLGTDVAIKVLQNTAGLESSDIARFYRESRLIGSLHHDHIIRVQDTGKTPTGDLFFVMEYLRGPNLRALLRRDGPLPWSRTRAIVLQVCDALDAIHRSGMIHRDLKPHNIVVDPRPDRPDFVKLLDFGVAKPLDDDRQNLTQTGVLLGTPPYMAPEYLFGHPPDRRVDIYALGVITFELLTGRLPTPIASANAELLQLARVTVAAEPVIARALARDPAHRYVDAKSFAAALLAVADEASAEVDETTTTRFPGLGNSAKPADAANPDAPGEEPATRYTPDFALRSTATAPLTRTGSYEPATPSILRRPTEILHSGVKDRRPSQTEETTPAAETSVKEPAIFVPVLSRPPESEPLRAPVLADGLDRVKAGPKHPAAPTPASVRAVTAPEPALERRTTRRIAYALFGLSASALVYLWPFAGESPVRDEVEPGAAPLAGAGTTAEPVVPPVVEVPPAPIAPTDPGLPKVDGPAQDGGTVEDDTSPPPADTGDKLTFEVEPHTPPKPPVKPPSVTGYSSYNKRLSAIKGTIRECGKKGIGGERVHLRITVDGSLGKAKVEVLGPAIMIGEPAVVCAVQAIEQLTFQKFTGAYPTASWFDFPK